MQQDLFEQYMFAVRNYYQTLQALYNQLKTFIRVTGYTQYGTHFVPTETTIFQQIRCLPQDVYYSPPVAWVEPKKGTLVYKGSTWDYTFHGGGLSFFEQTSKRDISGEFARTGELAITEHTTSIYIAEIPTITSNGIGLSTKSELYFEEMKAQKILLPVPPFFEGDDNTYIMNINTNERMQNC